MKVNELYSHTAQLGFETALEDVDGFYNTLNRALLQVCLVRPATRLCVLHHKPIKNLLGSDFDIHEASDVPYEAENAKSYYFEYDGIGTLHMEKYSDLAEEWQTVATIPLSSAKITPCKGFFKENGDFIQGKVRIRLVSTYSLCVRRVALYDEVRSASEEDIPAYAPYISYDISKLADDFMGLESPPIKEVFPYSAETDTYRVENGRIILMPYTWSGVYHVVYRHMPDKVEAAEDASVDETVLDMDEDLCSLLPLLIASYVWADDEQEKASAYYQLYLERVAEIQRTDSSFYSTPVEIKNVYGW